MKAKPKPKNKTESLIKVKRFGFLVFLVFFFFFWLIFARKSEFFLKHQNLLKFFVFSLLVLQNQETQGTFCFFIQKTQKLKGIFDFWMKHQKKLKFFLFFWGNTNFYVQKSTKPPQKNSRNTNKPKLLTLVRDYVFLFYFWFTILRTTFWIPSLTSGWDIDPKSFSENLEFESWIQEPLHSLQSLRHIMCRLVHHPESYLKPLEEMQHSHDLKIGANQFQHGLRSFFQSKILQYMLCASIFFKDDIPCMKWHHFVQSPYIKECSTSLKGI